MINDPAGALVVRPDRALDLSAFRERLVSVRVAGDATGDAGPIAGVSSVWSEELPTLADDARSADARERISERSFPEVVDERRHRAPRGAVGEIAVGGAGVADGYLGRSELNATKFGFSAGRLVEKRGDKRRMRLTGVWRPHGRLDNQVQPSGYRIELDDFKAVLLSDPVVTAAAVVLVDPRPDDPSRAELHGFVVLAPGQEDESARLLSVAREKLPAHIVPARITVVDALLLTPNGKLDVARLAATVEDDPAASTSAGPPAVANWCCARGETLSVKESRSTRTSSKRVQTRSPRRRLSASSAAKAMTFPCRISTRTQGCSSSPASSNAASCPDGRQDGTTTSTWSHESTAR
ncbi:AMP-binding enzyme [Streptomyces violaceusniger]